MDFQELNDIQGYGLPDYVKVAAVSDLVDDTQKLEAELFADLTNRQFPIHTKAAAYTSAVRFWKQALYEGKPAEPWVARRLKQATETWHVSGDVQTALNKLASEHEQYVTPIPDSMFALVLADGQRLFPMLDAETTQKSARAFFESRHKLPLNFRKQAAAALQEKLAKYSVDPDVQTQTYFEQLNANQSVPGSRAYDALMTRSQYMRPEFSKLASELKDTAKLVSSRTLSGAEAHQLMNVLDAADLEAELYPMYKSAGLRLPEESFYPETVKIPTVKLANNLELTHDQVKQAGSAPFRVLVQYQDAVFTDGKFSVEKAAAVLPTLPLESAELYAAAALSAINGKDPGFTREVNQPVAAEDVPLAGMLV